MLFSILVNMWMNWAAHMVNGQVGSNTFSKHPLFFIQPQPSLICTCLPLALLCHSLLASTVMPLLLATNPYPLLPSSQLPLTGHNHHLENQQPSMAQAILQLDSSVLVAAVLEAQHQIASWMSHSRQEWRRREYCRRAQAPGPSKCFHKSFEKLYGCYPPAWSWGCF